ncbi:carboxymuconolactone decarboxylase family protein [Cupriavidus sp. WKF15]|uniref:carboxymuconolactone decarboxylase family protein n=1 Tax=Cupriavidus sp. WKF15 TaxID=3032282 RepID=UPI0023E316E5|nr:carboxymuconolactone decarboxylase family protein [Cupriavidus sp. WKF15]WER48949.1 carboxymuconolactone decarboxylase family protein [Cupriavidus sp. WKF15]
MARIHDIDPDALQGEARSTFERVEREYGAFGNMLRVLGHRPPALAHLFGLLLDSARDALITRRHLEIVLVTASRLNACHYCISHHVPRLEALGVAPETVERILEPDVPGLDAVERLVRDYTAQVTTQRVTDTVVARLREHFTEAQVVELTLRAALCAFFARFNEALEIQVEPELLAAEIHAT